MTRRAVWTLIALAGGLLFAAPLAAQTEWPPWPSAGGHSIERGPGGYLSWMKLAAIAVIWLAWVRMSDWMNRDSVRFDEYTGVSPKAWNLVSVSAYLGGLAAVLFIPLFLAGFPLYVLGASLPLVIYVFFLRRGKIPEEARAGKVFLETVEQSASPLTLKAFGDNVEHAQSNLIRARQSEYFELTVATLYDALVKRAGQILLDYTRDAATVRYQIDGLWHPMPAMERPSGDALLAIMKTLANLNPLERRQSQHGQFSGVAGRDKTTFDLTSQGVPTGERVLIKLVPETTLLLELPTLGMQPDMMSRLAECLSPPGLVVISAPLAGGLSSTWQAVLNAADRYVSDWVAVVDHDDRETERVNIEVRQFDSRAGESPLASLKKLALKQPNVFVVPNPVDTATMDYLIDQVNLEKRLVVTQSRSSTAADALLKVMSLAANRKGFVRAAKAVTCQQLVRRLCDQCKQSFQANPQAIAQMGGDPRQNTTLYRHYELPPIEKRVDEEGKPIEMFPCATCGGTGYIGRIAVFELGLIDEEIRKVLLAEARPESVARVLRQQGNLTLLEEAYRAVLDGRTTIAEVQRVLQKKS